MTNPTSLMPPSTCLISIKFDPEIPDKYDDTYIRCAVTLYCCHILTRLAKMKKKSTI